MAGVRILSIAIGLAALFVPAEALAQARGRDNNAPAFCRDGGRGHPVFGWEWCEARGWGQRGARPRGSVDGRRIPYPNQRRADARFNDAGFENGYADGYEKGLDDGRDNRAYDPVRHRWYRDGDRRYDSRYGSRARYANVYRNGFREGYDAGYRDARAYRQGSTRRQQWPF